MSREPILGNRAEEQAQAEQGKDFGSINQSDLPRSGPELDVDVKDDGVETTLVPKIPYEAIIAAKEMADWAERATGASFALQHTPQDLLDAQLTEEDRPSEFIEAKASAFMVPAVGKVYGFHSRMARAVGRNRNREELIWYGVRPNMLMAALDLPPNSTGRIVVKQDILATEYACRECEGLGYSKESCARCRGAQVMDGLPCGACNVLGYGRDQRFSSGHVPCIPCRGSGWRTGVVIPEVAESMPITGIVVSLGPTVQFLKLGDRVMHSKFAGHGIKTPEKETFTSMRESEVIALIREL